MERIDASLPLLARKGTPTTGQRSQLLERTQVGPSPHSTVDDMGELLPVAHLKTTIHRLGHDHTLRWLAGMREGVLERLERTLALLQPLDQVADGRIGSTVVFVALFENFEASYNP